MRAAPLTILLVAVAACGSSTTSDEPQPVRHGDEPKIVADAKESAEWVAEAMRSSGYQTDFSPESLWEVDRFFDEQLTRPGKPKREGLLAEQRGPRLFAIGAYIGEVIRRNADGWAWHPAPDDPDDELNLGLSHEDSSLIWPIQRSLKRFTDGEENGIAVYAMSVADLNVGPRPR